MFAVWVNLLKDSQLLIPNFYEGGTMRRKSDLFKILNCVMLVVMAITTASYSPCFADTSSFLDSEMMTAFSDSMDTELGDRVKMSLEERGLEIDPENGTSTIVPGGEVTLVPLIPTDIRQTATSKESHQKSQFLAYINHEMLGRFLVFLEVMRNHSNEMTSTKIVFPSGRGVVLNINPFYIYQIDASQTGIYLQDNDDFENTIIISDTCETLTIIVIVLAALCLILVNPILCTIAGVIEVIVELLC